jgi:hypothetical protein
MQVFKMLLNSNIQRVLQLTALMYMPNIGANEKVLNVLWNVFNSGKNCIVSFKEYRQSGETTNLLAYAMTYIQTHNKPVIFIVNDSVIADRLTHKIGNINFLMFKTPNQFDIDIRGRNDIGLVIVDSQVTDVMKIIKHSGVIPNTQFVISTDETNIKYI